MEIDFTNYLVYIFLIIIGVIFAFGGIMLLYSLTRHRLVQKKQSLKSSQRSMLLIKVSRETGRKEEEIRDAKEMAILFSGVAEQLFSGLSSTYQKGWAHRFYGQEHFSFEIATVGGQIAFFVTCPKDLESLVEKQIHGLYPNASIEPVEYYNIFSPDPNAQVAAANLTLMNSYIYPIKTYRYLEADSMGIVTNVLSKMGEGASGAIQILVRPAENTWRKACEKKASEIQAGNKDKKSGFAQSTGAFIKDLGKAAAAKEGSKPGEPKIEEPVKLTPMKEMTLKALDEKAAKVGFDVQIRLATSAPNQTIADSHLNNLASAFAQFSSPELNGFKKSGRNKSQIITDFIFRNFSHVPKETMLLNSEELASVYHLPNKGIETPNILWLGAKDAPAPANLPQEGTIIGESIYRGERKLVRIKDDDRRRHIYAIGKTGVGKTTLYVSMILSDIRAGRGVCYIDPHGDAIEEILQKIPKERAEDVILFDPADTERPMGLNLLEWKTPEQKDFLVQEAVQIFYKLFDPEHTGIVGPQFEHWLRNAALTLMADPEGGTLIEIPRLFTDETFAEKQIKHVTDPIVIAFWRKQMAQTAQFHKSEMLNYFTSKFGRFMTNDMMRNIIGQRKSGFDIREIMDNGKILLINLSKGKVGEVNSNLLGMILVAKMQMAAMSRANIPENQRRDFYLYVDEFQNFATENFSQILSEARKYRLNLNITNQYVAQLEEKIRDAVFGNVGTLICFRIGAQDAEYIEKEFSPVFKRDDLINVDKYHAYIKLLIDAVVSKPFSMATTKDQNVPNPQMAEAVKRLSRLKFGQERAVVDREIRARAKIEEQAQHSEELTPPRREGAL